MFKANFSRTGLMIAIVLVASLMTGFAPTAASSTCTLLSVCASAQAGFSSTKAGTCFSGSGAGGGPGGGVVTLHLNAIVGHPPALEEIGNDDPLTIEDLIGGICGGTTSSQCTYGISGRCMPPNVSFFFPAEVRGCSEVTATTSDALGTIAAHDRSGDMPGC